MSCTAIVGLGNPGIQYVKTRHNLGFWLLDHLADSQKACFQDKSKFCAEIAKFTYAGKSFMLVKPLTFMNQSGKFLKSLFLKNNCDITRTILVHDELTLPVGHMKISTGLGDGGHNGVKSVFFGIGHAPIRLRLGIGQKQKPEMDLADYVLSKFLPEEIEVLENRLKNFLNALKSLMFEGVDRAMTKYNQSSLHTI